MHQSDLHRPERLPHETLTDYRARRLASKRAVQAMTLAHDHRQHQLPSSRDELRAAQRRNGMGPRAMFAFGVCNAAAKKRAAKLAKSYPLRDEHGAYTLTGARLDYIDPHGEPAPLVGRLPGNKCRRIWLAGISAQAHADRVPQ